MRIEIPIEEVQEFSNDHFHIVIKLKCLGDNQVKVTYCVDSVVLIPKEVKDDVIVFHYDADILVGILVKIVHFFLAKKLATMPIAWNADTKEILIDLKKIPELAGFRKFYYLSELHVVNDSILLIIYARNKKQNHIN